VIIDIHGHYTTAPPQLTAWRDLQVAFTNGLGDAPSPTALRISDDDISESLEGNQLRLMNARGIDVTVFSPRASFMAHHVGDLGVSRTWARVCNDLCGRVSRLFPDRFVPGAMLPQSPGADPRSCVDELTRAVEELDAVAVNLNPDPSGGRWTAPPLTDRSWYPIYEKLVEYQLPAMIHVSTSCNPVFHTTGAHYLNADTTAFMQLLQGDLFRDFPDLKLVIPHGGGAVPYHWGRFRGLAIAMGKPDIEEHLLSNVFFDTCVYHQPGIDLLTSVIPPTNLLFASEMIGAVRDVDPRTGYNFDDTKHYIDATPNLSPEERAEVLEGNARRVYPRLAQAIDTRSPRPNRAEDAS
jgi:4-oxalmesaconate hydratase